MSEYLVHRRRRKSESASSSTDTSTSSSGTDESNSSTATNVSDGYWKFRDQLANLGLELKDVPQDGNCLFSSFSDQLYGTTDYHSHLRHKTVEYLRAHRREMRPYCEARHYGEMIRDLAELGTYGDHTSLAALAQIYRVNVVVHRLGDIPRLVARGDKNEGGHFPQTHLAFHEDLEHYSSVRLIKGPATGPAFVETDLRILEKLSKKPRRTTYLSNRLRLHRYKLAFRLQRSAAQSLQ